MSKFPDIPPNEKTDDDLVVDFGLEMPDPNWQVIDDGVMGGLSRGQAGLTEHSVVFNGIVSLENNGGFSSLRSSYKEMDLSPFETMEIHFRSSGVIQAFTLETSRYWFEPNFKIILTPTKEDWQTLSVQLTDFKKYQVGRKLNENLTEEDKGDVIRMGFITGEKKAGSFELEVDYLKFY